MFITGIFFFNATVHTTLPLTSSFLMSLAVQFFCVSRFRFCVLSGAVFGECEGTAGSSHPCSAVATNQPIQTDSEHTTNTQPTADQQRTGNNIWRRDETVALVRVVSVVWRVCTST